MYKHAPLLELAEAHQGSDRAELYRLLNAIGLYANALSKSPLGSAHALDDLSSASKRAIEHLRTHKTPSDAAQARIDQAVARARNDALEQIARRAEARAAAWRNREAKAANVPREQRDGLMQREAEARAIAADARTLMVEDALTSLAATL